MVYNAKDILECIDDIANGKYIFKIKINFEDGDVEQVERIVFDLRDKYIGIISKSQVRIINIKKQGNQIVFLYTIPE